MVGGVGNPNGASTCCMISGVSSDRFPLARGGGTGGFGSKWLQTGRTKQILRDTARESGLVLELVQTKGGALCPGPREEVLSS